MMTYMVQCPNADRLISIIREVPFTLLLPAIETDTLGAHAGVSFTGLACRAGIVDILHPNMLRHLATCLDTGLHHRQL